MPRARRPAPIATVLLSDPRGSVDPRRPHGHAPGRPGERRRRARQGEGREGVFHEAPVLALRRPQLPDAAVLRRHAPAHLVLDGRRRVRRAAQPARRLSLRARRGDHGLERPAGRSSRARSTSSSSPITPTTWASSPTCSPASPSCSPIRPGKKWYDMIQSGKGAEAAIEIIVAFSHGTFPKDLMYFPGTRGYRGAWQETIDAAEALQRAGPLHGLHRLRVDVEHRRQQPPPQRHLPRQRRQGQPGRAVHRLSALRQRQPASICGSGWTPTRRRPAAACSRSRTTAT